MSDLLKQVIQDLINDRTEQAQVSIHDYIVAKTQEVAGLGQVQEETLAEALSKDTKAWVLKDVNPKATFKANKIMLPMTQAEYDKGLAKLLMKFDMFCPQNEKGSFEWTGDFKDGVATIEGFAPDYE
jgi:hypothetical protein